MAITTYSGDTDYIAQLHDKPITDDNLTSAQFKAKFDKFGTEFKAWFNGTFIPAVNSTFATKSAATHSADGLMTTTMYDKLDGIGAGANVISVASKTGTVTLETADISDLNTSGKVWSVYVTDTEPDSDSPDGIYLVYEEEEE